MDACGQATTALWPRDLLKDAALGRVEDCGCASSCLCRWELCVFYKISLVVSVCSSSRTGCCGSLSGGAVGLLAGGGAPLGQAEMRSPLRQHVGEMVVSPPSPAYCLTLATVLIPTAVSLSPSIWCVSSASARADPLRLGVHLRLDPVIFFSGSCV